MGESLNLEEVSAIVVDCGYRLHVEAGPGLLESVYEVVLAKMLEARGLQVRRQVQVPIKVFDFCFEEGFRADLIVNDTILIELKSVEKLAPAHFKQALTYLRLRRSPWAS
jgi:GxxExxY protein